jgi:sarcosine oxidase, subunit alpha
MMRSGPYRLATGGLLDRTRHLEFRFNQRTYRGHPGDSLASALLANSARTVSRSFKFHRPRGIFSCGFEEPHGLVQLGAGAHAVPSERAPMIELYQDLEASSQSGWPSVGLDFGRALDLVAPLWSAGFYNKTFIWPSWHAYEGVIRRLAGLGRSPRERDPSRYEIRNASCDVLVVGAGIAGLSAALDAARAGARVILAEQDSVPGGRAFWDGSVFQGKTAATWARDAVSQLGSLRDVSLLTRTMAVGYYDSGVVTLLERVQQGSAKVSRERYWVVRTNRIVLATGAIEQPLIFSNNDRPGILLAGAAQQYVGRYGVAPGRRVLFATNNDSAYSAAEDLHSAGVMVLGIADSRRVIPSGLTAAMRSRKIDVFANSFPIDTSGFGALCRVTLGRLSIDGQSLESRQTFECDALAVSGGWSPALHLYAQAGGRLVYDESSGSLRPVAPHPSIEVVGRAAQSVSIGPRVSPVGKPGRQWVDLLHDVTVADLQLALRENYTSIEHIKRYTTVGMAPDQGKTSAAASLDIIARLRGVSGSELGHTALRPPVCPVTLGAIAGREIAERFAPTRRLPIHSWHASHGACFQNFSSWLRPVVYLSAANSDPVESREAATLREARAVRTGAGLFDGSPLGKIEVRGPDALEFLDRFYINNLKTLQPGKTRYGLMLRETGVIFDDGTAVMLAPDHVLITTTSSSAIRVHAWLEEWHQCEWPALLLAITPVTEQWGTVSIAGPKARDILSRIPTDIDLSAAAFPHLGMRQGTLLGHPARIYRVSFTGELTYEINIPAGAAPELWNALLDAGRPERLQAIGLDAQLLLRLEKGFLHIGTDTDGTTVPDDVGWGKVAAGKARDYIGKRSLSLPENIRTDRLQLVGLRPEGSGSKPFIIGSHLKFPGSRERTDGWITSAGRAVLTGEPVAMAMLRGGRQRIGSVVTVHDAVERTSEARVVSLPFFDPAGDRMNA